jgi:hypothetical protein
VFLKFAVMALADQDDTRREFENQLVVRLRDDRYDATASYALIPDLEALGSNSVRQALLDVGIHAILILRPLEVAEGVALSPADLRLNPEEFTSVSRFISAYRGHDFDLRTVVQIAGFMLDPDASRLFWHGVIWLDDPVETQQNRIDRIVDLVQFNLNQSRSALREQLGYPPLRNE